jgi:hypothetical protein
MDLKQGSFVLCGDSLGRGGCVIYIESITATDIRAHAMNLARDHNGFTDEWQIAEPYLKTGQVHATRTGGQWTFRMPTQLGPSTMVLERVLFQGPLFIE